MVPGDPHCVCVRPQCSSVQGRLSCVSPYYGTGSPQGTNRAPSRTTIGPPPHVVRVTRPAWNMQCHCLVTVWMRTRELDQPVPLPLRQPLHPAGFRHRRALHQSSSTGSSDTRQRCQQGKYSRLADGDVAWVRIEVSEHPCQRGVTVGHLPLQLAAAAFSSAASRCSSVNSGIAMIVPLNLLLLFEDADRVGQSCFVVAGMCHAGTSTRSVRARS